MALHLFNSWQKNWTTDGTSFKQGNLLLVEDGNNHAFDWPFAQGTKTCKGKGNQTRVVQVKIVERIGIRRIVKLRKSSSLINSGISQLGFLQLSQSVTC